MIEHLLNIVISSTNQLKNLLIERADFYLKMLLRSMQHLAF